MAAPTMTRAPPRLIQPSSSDVSAPPPPSPPPSPPPLRPVSDDKNPWRINPAAGPPAAVVTLIGEPPSSWPPLCSAQRHRRSSDSPPLPPPPEIHDGTLDPAPADRDPLSSSSSEIGSREEMMPQTAPSSPPPPPPDTPASSPPPSVQAPPLPRISPSNAAAAEHVRSPRPPVSPQRRGGRGQRWTHQRGGGGGGPRNHYSNHRPPAPGWRPNWNVNTGPPLPPPPPPPPQYPSWGFYPGSAVGVVPPSELNPYYVPYPQPYGELVYADYNGEPYAAYYDHATYEMPYVPPLNSEISAGVPPPIMSPNVYVSQADTVKENVLSQIEYYFSEDNLVKDIYLRQQMDVDGWVDINKIASFRKVAALTDDTNLIRDALMPSNIVELQGNKMRRRNDWQRWVLQQ